VRNYTFARCAKSRDVRLYEWDGPLSSDEALQKEERDGNRDPPFQFTDKGAREVASARANARLSIVACMSVNLMKPSNVLPRANFSVKNNRRKIARTFSAQLRNNGRANLPLISEVVALYRDAARLGFTEKDFCREN